VGKEASDEEPEPGFSFAAGTGPSKLKVDGYDGELTSDTKPAGRIGLDKKNPWVHEQEDEFKVFDFMAFLLLWCLPTFVSFFFLTNIRIDINGVSAHFSNPYVGYVLGPLLIAGICLFLFLVVTGTVARHRILDVNLKNVRFESWLFFVKGPAARRRVLEWKDIRLVRTGRSIVLGLGLETVWVFTKSKKLQIREGIEVSRTALRNDVFPAMKDICKKEKVRFEDRGNWGSGFERRAWEFPGLEALLYGLLFMLGWGGILSYNWSRLNSVMRPSFDNFPNIFLLIILPIFGALLIAWGCKEIVAELIKADGREGQKKGTRRGTKKSI